MQRRGSILKGIATLSLMVANVVFWVPLLMTVALAKLLVPLARWRKWTSRAMTALAEAWIACNGAIFGLMRVLRLQVEGAAGLSTREWYLVVSNHRSWVDILVLQKAFNRRIPFLKFFLKQQLIYVPLLGIAWWALDFPIMKRHSATYLVRHPEARGQDLAATRKACARFAHMPTSIMNFVEGTRFTPSKHAASKSPYRHLLPPRAGGIAFVLGAMDGLIEAVVDVTIAYPQGRPSVVDLFCGRVREVRVDVRVLPPPGAGDYENDAASRDAFQAWLNALWTEKDRSIGRMAGIA